MEEARLECEAQRKLNVARIINGVRNLSSRSCDADVACGHIEVRMVENVKELCAELKTIAFLQAEGLVDSLIPVHIARPKQGVSLRRAISEYGRKRKRSRVEPLADCMIACRIPNLVCATAWPSNYGTCKCHRVRLARASAGDAGKLPPAKEQVLGAGKDKALILTEWKAAIIVNCDILAPKEIGVAVVEPRVEWVSRSYHAVGLQCEFSSELILNLKG